MQLHTLYKVPVNAPTNKLVETAAAWKPKLGPGTFCATVDSRSDSVAKLSYQGCSQYGGWNGFYYEGYGQLSPDLRPMAPAMGVIKPLQSLGDSGQWFANFQWVKQRATGSGTNLPSTFDVQATFFKDMFARFENVVLGAFVLDCFQSLQNFYNTGNGVPLGTNDPYGHGPRAIQGLKNAGVPVWFVGVQIVDGPHKAKTEELMTFLGTNLPSSKFVHIHVGDTNIGTPPPGMNPDRIIHAFPVAMDGTYEGSFGVVPAMTPPQFKAEVMNNPAFANESVMVLAQDDSIQVANQL